MLENIIGLGFICVLVPLVAEYAQLRDYATKSFSLYMSSGVILILAGSLNILEAFQGATQMVSLTTTILEMVAWFMLLIGTFGIIYSLLAE